MAKRDDINFKLLFIQLPEYELISDEEVKDDIQDYLDKIPEMEYPTGEKYIIWKSELAVQRYVDSIIKKIAEETGIDYHNI